MTPKSQHGTLWHMRGALGQLACLHLARMAAPDAVEWRTTIKGPDLLKDRTKDEAAVGRARARAGWAAMLGVR